MRQVIRSRFSFGLRYFASALAIATATPAAAEKINVAVAANFTAAMKEIAGRFEAETGHEAVVSFGSTGKLYAQIRNGAPFGLFLAADAARPQRLEQEGKTLEGSRFTYAIGKLVLWSPDESQVTREGESIDAKGEGKIALLPEDEAGSRWTIPQELYTPLEQQAVLLEKGADNAAAKALHVYLQSDTAREIIERYGYGLK